MVINTNVIDDIIEVVSPLIRKNFGPIHDSFDYYDYDFLYWIERELKDAGYNNVKVFHGISKCVISCLELEDIVIKIPFCGIEDENEDTGELIWCPFEFADATDHSDYCMAECEKYNKLVKNNLNCFVAETIFYKENNKGVKFYLQEYITPLYLDVKKRPYSPQTEEIARKMNKDLDIKWVANCIEKYGADALKRFFEYCEKVDSDILGDTHSGNLGYRKDGTPAFLDFSNYNEDF